MAEISDRLDRNNRSASPKSAIVMPETTDRLGPKSAIAFNRNHRSRWSEIRTFAHHALEFTRNDRLGAVSNLKPSPKPVPPDQVLLEALERLRGGAFRCLSPKM